MIDKFVMMKRILIPVTLILSLFNSCTKENLNENLDLNSFLIKASIEKPQPDTKTSLGEMVDGKTPVLWTLEPQADEINIYEGSSSDKNKFTLTKIDNGVGTFSGEALAKSDKYFTFYPASRQTIYGAMKFVFPELQEYVKDNISSNLMPMCAEFTEGESISFKNLFGILRLQIQGEITVKKIEVLTTNYYGALNGKGTITSAYGGFKAKLDGAYGNSKLQKVVLSCGTDGIVLSATEITNFNIVLPAFESYNSDLKIRIYQTDSKFDEFLIKKPSKSTDPNAIQRNNITIMPVIKFAKPVDYIDEYGINHGGGTKIGANIWAPVNCGYHATNHKYGKYYQWGRKDGQAYKGEKFLGTEEGTVFAPQLAYGEAPLANTIYRSSSSQWMDKNNGVYAFDETKEWNSLEGSGLGNPCPEGWRVPTTAELKSLMAKSEYYSSRVNNITGKRFSGNDNYNFSEPYLWLPASGYIQGSSSSCTGTGSNNNIYYWTSSNPNSLGEMKMAKGAAYGSSPSFSDLASTYAAPVRCVQAE